MPLSLPPFLPLIPNLASPQILRGRRTTTVSLPFGIQELSHPVREIPCAAEYNSKYISINT